MINSKLLFGERTLYAFTESKMRIGVCKCAFLPLLNAFSFSANFRVDGNRGIQVGRSNTDCVSTCRIFAGILKLRIKF